MCQEIRLAKAVSRLLLEPYGYRFDVYGGRVVVRAKSSGAIYGWDSLRDCLLGGSRERYAWYASVFDFLAGRSADGDFRLRLRTPSGETFIWRDSHEFLFGCVYSKFHRWGSAFSLLRDLVFDTLEPPDGMSWQELALVLSAKGIV